MAALTTERDTKKRDDSPFYDLPVAASTVIWQGSLVCMNASGYLVPGAIATTLKAVGRAEQTVDNSAGANGDVTCKVQHGIFKWENAGGDAVVQADIYAACYVTDDQTVSKTDGTGTKSSAGRVVQVDSDGVCVQTDPRLV